MPRSSRKKQKLSASIRLTSEVPAQTVCHESTSSVSKRLSDEEIANYLQNDDLEQDILESEESEADDEVIFQSDHNTDSEEELSESEDIFIHNRNNSYFIAKDKKTRWKKIEVHSKYAKISSLNKVLPEPTRNINDIIDEKAAFQKFFDTSIIDNIVKYTNIFIKIKQYKRERDAKPTTKQEILAVIGLLYLAGIKKANHTNFHELWTDDGTGIEIFRGCISYKRFFFLLRCLHFDDKSTRIERQKVDKLAAIRIILDPFVENCINSYNVGEFVTIDEKLEAFRGRCSFIQYMPNKPAKYGIKIFALCDSKTFYTKNLEVYCGKQPEGQYSKLNTPTEIVHRLVTPIQNTGRNLTCDNWYTSYPLAMQLLEKKFTIVGTLRKNKAQIPPEFLPNSQRNVKSSLFGFQKNITLVSYVPKKKKAVILLSTMHNNGSINPKTGKPDIIELYNATKGGVDTVDQMCSSYSVSKRTRRWPMAIFFALLNIAGINAQILYHANNSETPKVRRIFLKNLAFALMKEHLIERAQIPSLPVSIKTIITKYKKPEEEKAVEQPVKRRARCRFCPNVKRNNTTILCTTCKKPACKQHVSIKYSCVDCNASAELERSSDA